MGLSGSRLLSLFPSLFLSPALPTLSRVAPKRASSVLHLRILRCRHHLHYVHRYLRQHMLPPLPSRRLFPPRPVLSSSSSLFSLSLSSPTSARILERPSVLTRAYAPEHTHEGTSVHVYEESHRREIEVLVEVASSWSLSQESAEAHAFATYPAVYLCIYLSASFLEAPAAAQRL